MQDQLERRHASRPSPLAALTGAGALVGVPDRQAISAEAHTTKGFSAPSMPAADLKAYVPRRRALENVPAAHRPLLGSNPQMFQTTDGQAYVQSGSTGTIRRHNLLDVPGFNRREKQRNARAVKAGARKARLSKR